MDDRNIAAKTQAGVVLVLVPTEFFDDLTSQINNFSQAQIYATPGAPVARIAARLPGAERPSRPVVFGISPPLWSSSAV